MNTSNQFDWVDFYKEFAGILRSYRGRRQELISKVRKIYEITGLNLPTLERDNQIVDIDPFTVFGLFNKKLTDANRLSILQAIASLFEVKTAVPTAFDSIPVLNPQNATFYYFVGDRADSDIDELWELFETALDYAANPTAENRAPLSKYFDLAIRKKGNGNSKITMGLYWIAPNAFLNLDQRNTWYIYESGKIPSDLVQTLPAIQAKIPSSKYFDIVEKLRDYLQINASPLKDFKELSFEAWRYSEQVNQEKKQELAQRADRTAKGAAVADEGVETTHYWIYSPGDGAAIWDECYNGGIMAIGWDEIGDLSAYSSKDEIEYNGYDLNTTLGLILQTLSDVSQKKYYGATILIDVLRESQNKRVLSDGLDACKGYGKLVGVKRDDVQFLVEWLIENEYIRQTRGPYPVLHPTYNGEHYSEVITRQKLQALKRKLENTDTAQNPEE